MMMILASARPLIWANQQIYNGHWSQKTEKEDPNYYFDFYKTIDTSHEIYGKTLESGRIKAAIDVYDKEPISRDNPFLKLDPMKVLLLPHFAGVSVERITFQSKAATENITDFLNGKRTNHVFDAGVFDEPEFKNHGGLIWNTMK